MTDKQHPLGSGFPAASTAADVISGIDIAGRNVIVTGGHAGLGLETTRALGRAGQARVARHFDSAASLDALARFFQAVGAGAAPAADSAEVAAE